MDPERIHQGPLDNQPAFEAILSILSRHQTRFGAAFMKMKQRHFPFPLAFRYCRPESNVCNPGLLFSANGKTSG